MKDHELANELIKMFREFINSVSNLQNLDASKTAKLINRKRTKKLLDDYLSEKKPSAMISQHDLTSFKIQPAELITSTASELHKIIIDGREFINAIQEELELTDISLLSKNDKNIFSIINSNIGKIEDNSDIIIEILDENDNSINKTNKENILEEDILTKTKQHPTQTKREINKNINNLNIDKKIIELEEKLNILISQNNEFNNAKESYKELQTIKADFKDKILKINSDAKEVSDKKNMVLSDIGVISEAQLSGEFEKSAKDEENSADKIRRYAYLIIAILIGVTGTNYYLSFSLDLSTLQSTVFIRSIYVLPLILPIYYLIKESAKHRSEQHRLRQVALTLKSLEGFLGDMDKSDKNSLKSDLAKMMFSHKEYSGSYENNYLPNSNNLVTKIVEAVTNKSSDKEKQSS